MWQLGAFHLSVSWGHSMSLLSRGKVAPENTNYNSPDWDCASASSAPCVIISNMTGRSEWATGIQFSRSSPIVLQINNQLAVLQKLCTPAGELPGCAEEVHGVDFPNWVTSVSPGVIFIELGENFQETSLTGTHKNSRESLQLLNF